MKQPKYGARWKTATGSTKSWCVGCKPSYNRGFVRGIVWTLAVVTFVGLVYCGWWA